ncbi:hypothetical protein KM043_002428 [Ampulex compressa]|nr:hypothetical protein KM043_002428 [Ampulex compressa]
MIFPARPETRSAAEQQEGGCRRARSIPGPEGYTSAGQARREGPPRLGISDTGPEVSRVFNERSPECRGWLTVGSRRAWAAELELRDSEPDYSLGMKHLPVPPVPHRMPPHYTTFLRLSWCVNVPAYEATSAIK